MTQLCCCSVRRHEAGATMRARTDGSGPARPAKAPTRRSPLTLSIQSAAQRCIHSGTCRSVRLCDCKGGA